MIYTSRCTIGFMVVLLTSCFGCNSEERIEYHLQTLNDINSNISTGHWRVFYGFLDEQEEHLELERKKADTSYVLTFSYFPTSEKYIIYGFYQSFLADGHYHELSLHNNDTMYHFFNLIENDKRITIPFEDRCFIAGKYYFLYENGWLSEQQKQYYELHKDSLTRVRGNDVANLPEAE